MADAANGKNDACDRGKKKPNKKERRGERERRKQGFGGGVGERRGENVRGSREEGGSPGTT